jgi:hypothetical protein
MTVKNIVGKLKTYCPTTDFIEDKSLVECCSWSGNLDCRNDHEAKDCAYRMVTCPNRCENGLKLQLRQVTHHLREVCPCRRVKCVHCDGLFAANVIHQHATHCYETKQQREEQHLMLIATKSQQCATRRSDSSARFTTLPISRLNLLSSSKSKARRIESVIPERIRLTTPSHGCVVRVNKKQKLASDGSVQAGTGSCDQAKGVVVVDLTAC